MKQRTKALLAATVALSVLSACASTADMRNSAGDAASSVGSGVKSGASSVRTSVGNRASAVGGWFSARRPGARSRQASNSLSLPSEQRTTYAELENRLAAAEQRVADLSEQLALNTYSATSTDSTLAPLPPIAAPATSDVELLGAPGGDARAPLAAPESSSSAGFGLAASETPPDAAPGQCFARVLTPPVTRVEREEMPAAEASSEIQIIPARYEIVEERVLVEQERTVTEVVPATYREYTEQMVVEEERTELVTIPAVYRDETEEIIVREAYVTWKRGEGLFGSDEVDETRILPTGEVMCRVTIPAETKVVTRQVLVSPARTEERTIPARIETVTKRELDQPARVIERVLPAVYETVSHRREVEPERTETIVVPASTQWVERKVVVEEPRLEWREVLCRTNATRSKIAEVQQALQREGFSPGPADGVFGARTLAAMERFQRANNVAIGQLTRETVEALGVPFETRDI